MFSFISTSRFFLMCFFTVLSACGGGGGGGSATPEVSQPPVITAPNLVGAINISGNPGFITVADGYAYITQLTDPKEIVIVDISNPANPVLAGKIDESNFPCSNPVFGKIVITGNTAIVASGSKGPVAFDISDPSMPSYTGISCVGSGVNENALGFANGVAFVFHRGVFANSDTFSAVSMTDLTMPSPAGSVNLLREGFAMTVSGQYVYALSNRVNVPADPVLMVFDITSPFTPVHIVSMGVSAYGDIEIQGNYAYIVDYLGNTNQLEILDISNPSSPFSVAILELSFYPGGIDVEGNYVYVGSNNDLHIIDISDKSAPVVKHRVAAGKGPDDVEVVGGYAYVTTNDGLEIYDISGL